MAIDNLTQMHLCVFKCGYLVPDKIMQPTQADSAVTHMVESIIIAHMKKVIAVIEYGYTSELCVVCKGH
jgi:hypothetical protein